MTPPLSVKKIVDPKPLLTATAWGWLSYKPSLTKRLREFTDNKITLHLIHEDWEVIDNNPSWIRKIQWRLHNSCWIEANLQIPKTSINAETQCLLNTHKRPIGEQLFTEPSLQRSEFEFFQILNYPNTWIRQSIFHFKQQPLTLKETFFPPFFKAIELCSHHT